MLQIDIAPLMYIQQLRHLGLRKPVRFPIGMERISECRLKIFLCHFLNQNHSLKLMATAYSLFRHIGMRRASCFLLARFGSFFMLRGDDYAYAQAKEIQADAVHGEDLPLR